MQNMPKAEFKVNVRSRGLSLSQEPLESAEDATEMSILCICGSNNPRHSRQ